MKIEKIEKGNYFIKKGEQWKKVACIIRGRLKVKLNDNPIDNEKDSENPFENMKIGNLPIDDEMTQKLLLHLDTPEKIMIFKHSLMKINSDKINSKYIKQNPLKTQSYYFCDKKICKKKFI